jgi:FkbM family methyltransferase
VNNLWPKPVFRIPERQTKLFAHEIDPYLDFSAVKLALDVGSRDGFVAMEFREWFPNASVCAFECDPVGVTVCRRNLKDTGVTLVESAVLNLDGTTVFNHVISNPGTSSVLVPAIDFKARGIAASNALDTKEVPCLRLDTWAAGKVPDVVWIDVQGAELPVLRGMGEMLSKASAVFIEAATKEIYHGQALKDAIISYMVDNGFKLVREQRYWEMESYYVFVNSQLSHSGFPCYREWLSSVCHPQDLPCRQENYYRCAREKCEMSRQFKPMKIVEIGVRLGYSAHAFLHGAPLGASYTGFDIVGGDHGGTKIAGLEYPETILKRDFPKSEIRLVKMNTQKVDDLGLADVDFFHVDGDHTTAGALHDMEMAWKALRAGGVMVVDDYDFLPKVKVAVDGFIAAHQIGMERCEYRKTFRGDMIMVKK